MPPKKEKGKDDSDKARNKAGKVTAKKKCNAPIATGNVMAQRALPPAVCCPPSGCPTKHCIRGPGC